MNSTPTKHSISTKSARFTSGGRGLRLVRIACLALALLAAGMFIAGLPLFYRRLFEPCLDEACRVYLQLTPEQMQRLASYGAIVGIYVAQRFATTLMLACVCFVVGALLFQRRANDLMALYVGLMVVLLGASFSDPLHMLVVQYPTLAWAETVISFASGLLIFLFLYLFPDGRFVPAWTRWLAASPLLLLLARIAGVQFPNVTFLLVGFFLLLTGGYAQWHRYRFVSNSVQRQQTKWASFGFGMALVVLVATWIILGVAPALYEPGSPTFFVIDTMLYGGMTLIPLSIGFAILRYRLYDVDFLINRTLVYGVLTATLVLIYICSVVLLQSLFRTIAGQNSQVAIVASTLGIAALFTPLRRRLQHTIDRVFYRHKYNAARVLAAFNQQVRDETDIDRLTHNLLAAVRSTFRPEHVALWPCREPQRLPSREQEGDTARRDA